MFIALRYRQPGHPLKGQANLRVQAACGHLACSSQALDMVSTKQAGLLASGESSGAFPGITKPQWLLPEDAAAQASESLRASGYSGGTAAELHRVSLLSFGSLMESKAPVSTIFCCR